MSNPVVVPAMHAIVPERFRRLRVLLIARAYPPTLGGMENAAFQLATNLRSRCELIVIANRHGKKALPLFLAYAAVKSVLLARHGRVDAIHLTDALQAPLGLILKKLTGLPVTCSVNGLDVTWPQPVYQAVVPRSLARLDGAMPISGATAAEVHRRTHGSVPLTVVPLGVNSLAAADGQAAARFRAAIGISESHRVLLTVNRLVRRKGHAWFIERVLPQLPPDVVYVVVGDGPERAAIAAAASGAGVAQRVRFTGRIADAELAYAYAAADLFVMPNVPVAGDMEGFGLVALEAASAGVPVVASRLEGITEAVHDGVNGTLVASCDAAAWTHAVADLLMLPRADLRAIGDRHRVWTHEHCSWDSVAERFVELISANVGARSVRSALASTGR